MRPARRVLAVDLGAGSGRCIVGEVGGEGVRLTEVHRFRNVPVRLPTGLHWDVLHLFHHLVLGLRRAGRDGPLASVGVDTWGVDFALLDRAGALVGNPYHYRDPRTEGMLEEVTRRIPREELYRRTGIQFLPINTLVQLMAMVVRRDPALEAASRFLMVSDLFAYWLAGEAVCEYTNATTTQCYDAERGTWALDLLERLGIPGRLFPPIVPPGTVLGPLHPALREEGGEASIQVVLPASHDTASAVAAVPASGASFAYISSGTWSLVGTELPSPHITPESLAFGFTNEGGAFGRICFLKNVTGLWLLEEARRRWAEEGEEVSYETLLAEAEAAPAAACFVNPDDARFLRPGDVPARLRELCRETGQPVPRTRGEVVRCILESLALRYRWVLDGLDRVLGSRAEVVHVVGGGSRNRLLCQLTAEATGRPVEAGPQEATALGNVLVQLHALGEVAPGDVRALARRSTALEVYEHRDRARWEEAYGRFCRLLREGGGQRDPR